MSGEITLHYWPGRGLMEIPRMCLAIAGKTNGAGMTDNRHGAPEGFDFACNMGRMPVAECAQGSIGQSLAINFFVASECGLMGSSTFEAAKIMEVGEHVGEIRKAYQAMVPYGTVADEATLNKWFDEGADDSEGAANMANRKERQLKWYLGRLNAALTGTDGFAVGNALTLGDLALYGGLAEYMLPEENPEKDEAARSVFSSRDRTMALINACAPKVAASIEKVASNEQIKAYLAARGPQGF